MQVRRMPERDGSALAGTSVAAHLARGAVGFGLIGAGFGLTVVVGPVALVLAVPGMVALRGCPMCWTAGLIEIVSAGRLRRSCSENGCTLSSSAARSTVSRTAGLLAFALRSRSRADRIRPRFSTIRVLAWS